MPAIFFWTTPSAMIVRPSGPVRLSISAPGTRVVWPGLDADLLAFADSAIATVPFRWSFTCLAVSLCEGGHRPHLVHSVRDYLPLGLLLGVGVGDTGAPAATSGAGSASAAGGAPDDTSFRVPVDVRSPVRTPFAS